MTTALRGGYKWRRRGKKGELKNLGKRDTRVVRKNISQGEGDPIWISGSGLSCLVAISVEPRSRKFGVKVTLELHQGLEQPLFGPPTVR